MPETDDAADLVLLEESVREAGNIARKFFGGEYKRWSKGPGNPVTEADLEVDRYPDRTVARARPGYGWLSEETEDTSAAAGGARTCSWSIRLTARLPF